MLQSKMSAAEEEEVQDELLALQAEQVRLSSRVIQAHRDPRSRAPCHPRPLLRSPSRYPRRSCPPSPPSRPKSQSGNERRCSLNESTILFPVSLLLESEHLARLDSLLVRSRNMATHSIRTVID